jgi:hypothetical protein
VWSSIFHFAVAACNATAAVDGLTCGLCISLSPSYISWSVGACSRSVGGGFAILHMCAIVYFFHFKL